MYDYTVYDAGLNSEVRFLCGLSMLACATLVTEGVT